MHEPSGPAGPETLLVALVLAPLVAAIAALFLRGRALAALHTIALPGGVVLALALAAETYRSGPLAYALGGWEPPLGIALRADGAAVAFLVLTATVTALGGVYARAWPGSFEAAGRAGRPLFWPLWYMLWASLNALFLAGDVFNLYVALELITLASVILVAQSDERAALVAGMRYLLSALLGSILYLLGVALIYGAAGTLDMTLLAENLERGASEAVGAVLMTAGLALKMALFPFHFWLPPAHSHAAAPASAVLSGLVVKAWFFLSARLWLGPFAEIGTEGLFLLLGLFGAGAVVWGSLQAWRERRLKLIVAYSTVAQLGYLFLLFPLFAAAPAAAWNGAFFHVLAHGLAKAAAFLAAGNVLYALGTDRVDEIAGLGRHLRMSLMAFAIAGVSLIGLPPSGGFVAKWLLLEAAFETGQLGWAVLLLTGSLLAGGYMFRVLGAAMTTPETSERQIRRVPRVLEIVPLVLATGAMLLGIGAALPLDLLSVGTPFGVAEPLERDPADAFWLPVVILLSSFVPGIAIFFLPERRTGLRTALNLTGALVKTGLIGILLLGVLAGVTYEARLAFLPGLDLVLRADPLSLQFVTLSAGLWLLTTIYAVGYLEGAPDRSRFFGFFSLSVTASTGIALSGNLVTFLVFYEMLTLATYPLVVHRGVEKSLAAGRTYLAYTLVGGAAVLAGTVLLHVIGGNLEFSAENSLAALNEAEPGAVALVFLLLIGGMGVKAALVPLHGWLPQAMVAPAPVSALLHAVAVVKAGAFGVVRVLYDIFGIGFSHVFGGTAVLAAIAAITIIYGSLRALAQDELKRRLAFSTVSQLAYIALGAALASPIATIGALVHIVHQGVMKITLFFCAGNLAEGYGIHKVSEMNGMGRLMPVTMAAFTVGAAGMIGLPPVAGFVSKWYLAGGGVDAGAGWVVLVLAASSAFNAAYFLPIIIRAWFLPLPEAVPEKVREIGPWLLLPPVATAIVSLGAGLFAGMALSPLGWAELIAERTYYGVSPEP